MTLSPLMPLMWQVAQVGTHMSRVVRVRGSAERFRRLRCATAHAPCCSKTNVRLQRLCRADLCRLAAIGFVAHCWEHGGDL